jgi:cobalt-zinc-cadmium efflux system membrane fusion protein
MKKLIRILFIALMFSGTYQSALAEQQQHDHAHEETAPDHRAHTEDGDEHAGHDHAAHSAEEHETHAVDNHNDHVHGSDEHVGHDHDSHAEAQGKPAEATHDDHDHDNEGERGQHDSAHNEHGHDQHSPQVADDGHEGHGHDEHGHEEGGIALSETQRELADIRVSRVEPRPMPYQIYAPGEVKANAYTSYLVSPRVDSVVLKRHVQLGSHVHRGEPLVTLFSADVADAQASYRINLAEWQRVEKLGRKAIGEKRYVAARNEFISVKSRLKAFGLSDNAISRLDKNEPDNAGEYTLVASTSGVVLADDFHQGQRVEAGDALMELVDETRLWVEARISGQNMKEIPKGTLALIRIADQTVAAQIEQEAHAIDPVTRTRVLRLVIDNESHRFHPGMFADVYIQFMTDEPVVALKESALMRGADGHWVVYVEEKEGEFEAREVELGRMLGDRREVFGLKAGERIVTDGAFFVASQEAKGGFDPHNH